MNYIVAAVGEWNRSLYELNILKYPGIWQYASTPEELTELLSMGEEPRYIFFLHWRWIVPKFTIEKYECVCFHMTDVPFGRGGSPLQNLIVRGYQDTVLTALQMEEGLDSGPVYLKYPLSLDGSAEEIYKRAANLSWDMIAQIITTQPIPQEQVGPITEFKRRVPKESEIPSALTIEQVYDYIRMLDADGYPKAFLEKDDYRLVFENAELDKDKLVATVSIKIRDKSI